MTCDNTQIGQLLSYDGKPVSFDALAQHAFKMDFAKIPNTIFFLQGVNFPGISVAVSQQASPHLDFQEIGSKIEFEPLVINFLVDAEMRNHFEIYNWMKNMIAANKLSDHIGDAILTVNNSKAIRFVDAFPISLGSIQFVSNQDTLKYITCTASFNFDWYEIISL